jgi:DNA-binding CsgD family transcriptional regulator
MFLGREKEHGRLCAAVNERRMVVVCGGVGVGKSALVGQIEPGPARLLIGQALPSTSQRSFHPVLHALRWPPNALEPPAMAARVVSALDPQDRLVLEDLQWADRGTLELLVDVAGHCSVVVTVEAGTNFGRQVLRLAQSLDAEILELGPLPTEATTELVGHLRPDLLPGERGRIANAAAGNPLVATLLARSFDQGNEPRGDEAALLDAVVGRHSRSARSTLALLALAPGPVHMVRLAGTDNADVEDLEAAGLVTVSPEGFVAPTHRVFADWVLAKIGPGERRQLAGALAEMTELEPRQRADYLLQAGRPLEALSLATRCLQDPVGRADQAAVLLVAARASQQVRSTRPTRQPGDVVDECEHEDLVLRATGALNDTGRHREAMELLGDPCAFSPSHRPPAAVEALRSALGRGDPDRARAIAESVAPLLDAAEGADAARARSINAMLNGWSEDRTSDADEPGSTEALRTLAREQLAVARGGAARSHASLLVGLAAYSDDMHDATAWFGVAREEAQRCGELAAELEAARNLVMVQISLGQHEAGRDLARTSAERAAAAGEPAWEMEFRTWDVLSRFYDGADHDEALSWLSFVRTAPVRLETRAIATAVLATLLADRGEGERSGSILRDWTAPEAIEGFEPMIQAVLLWGATQCAWILGDTTEAIRLASWVTDLVPAGYPTLAGTQVVWRWAQYEAGLELTAPDPTGGLLDCAELEADAISRLAAGDAVAAAEGFEAAAASWRPILWRCALRSQWGAGRAWIDAGEPDRAVAVLEAVATELDAAGCKALRPRVTAALRAADGRGTTGMRGSRSDEEVTHQERAVMSLVADGLRTAEISRRLGITPATVQSHVRSVMGKLGVHSRAEAAGLLAETSNGSDTSTEA